MKKNLSLILLCVVFLSNANAQFTTSSFGTRVDITSANSSLTEGRFATADFNNDGKMDIVSANTGDGNISIFKNIKVAYEPMILQPL